MGALVMGFPLKFLFHCFMFMFFKLFRPFTGQVFFSSIVVTLFCVCHLSAVWPFCVFPCPPFCLPCLTFCSCLVNLVYS